MRLFLLLFILFPVLCPRAIAQEEGALPVVVDGDELSYLKAEDKVIAKGNVRIKYEDLVLTCDKAVYEIGKSLAYVQGKGVITSDEGIFEGEDINYDFVKREIVSGEMRVESPPVYVEADSAEGLLGDNYKLKRGFVTTCDLEKPHYRLTATRINIYPGKKITARNVVFKVGNFPLFYFPYYSQPIDDDSFPVEISPGKDSDWGLYTLTRLRYHLGDYNKGKIIYDWYEDRGEGKGLMHSFNHPDKGESLINLYYIQDKLVRKDDDLAGLPYERYKTQYAYDFKKENFSLVAEFNKFSDAEFMKDFFYREYEVDTHPYSYVLADWAFPRSSLSFLFRKRANLFYSETEYLPQIEYNVYKYKISQDMPLFYNSDFSVSNLSQKGAGSRAGNDSMRMNSHNVLSYDTNISWLTISPYYGLYNTYYSDAYNEENIVRSMSETGITFSTYIYKIFSRENGLFFNHDITKIRHGITPILEYSYLSSPTVPSYKLFQFDSVDSLTRKESFVFTLENKFDAKSKDREWQLFYFAPSVEYLVHEEGKGSYFNKVTLDSEFYPWEGVSINGDSLYNCQMDKWTEANVDFSVHDKGRLTSVSFGQRYAHNDSSQSTFSLNYKLTPKVEFMNYLRYEYLSGEFKEQQYIIRRDLHCWEMDLGLDVNKDKDYTFWIIFRVKAFPRMHLGFEHVYRGAKKEY